MKMLKHSALALGGGKPAVTMKCPAWPVSGRQELIWMEQVVRSGKWSWLGPHERAFCKEYAKFIGSKYCLCLANGTVTIQCALQGVGVKPGDEVIVPGLTFVATAQAALDVGANVVLVDIDPETLCIDPAAIEKAITRKTKAIIPVHLYGCMCDMDAIMNIARRHKLKVVEDVAHQHGSRWRNRGAGAIGDAGSFSFQQSKLLTSGEGGAVTCNDKAVYETVHALKHVGWGPDGKPANRYGHNYRITEMQAVLLRGGLRRLGRQTGLRDENAQYLAERLAAMGGPLRAARRDPRVTRQAYYTMTLVFDPSQAGGVTKPEYMQALRAERCGLGNPYCPVYASPQMNLYDVTSPVPFRDKKTMQNFRTLKLPNVEKAVHETALVLDHAHLLGTRRYLDQLLLAIRKVNDHLAQVKALRKKRGAGK
ncbi:MAG: DegT/DnrJ/EryC1/StrS family aminotransferase [Verrucomicrobia bacterium]|nr:DegT/DnrJ/EryC1/StrS family aminotransferase [Verrucomicrobiota bacterium]MCG2679030.1 DegT/DnrJ/EryC1/StrS family aminotransferase [Kiritimatiellia bacterium]MBU4248382.1 DegT/DnrJ/EryC1/StrS family aminotransferase [Verrucomicrobiota bacterium]MBU4289767.1 DegT/DnrJ/EryC1/StrS family aminotransferase [Verrucomicrobiota bacterium]MBU4428519.1 DegT/DnrJ/EryC1/StrS family aminotransferase [Verrucomicrobiota bacterium]